MNYLKYFNELVKNPILLKSYLKKMIGEIGGITKIDRSNIRYETESPIYHKLIVTQIDIKLSNVINNLLEKYKNILLRNDIVFSYKEYIRNKVDISDDLDIIVSNDMYLEYIIYLKNVHTKRIKPKRFIYHYIGKDDLVKDEILKKGLIPKHHKYSKNWVSDIYLEYPDAIFAVNSRDIWREGYVFEIDTLGLKNKWWEDLNFVGRPDLIMTFEPIPLKHIRLM